MIDLDALSTVAEQLLSTVHGDAIREGIAELRAHTGLTTSALHRRLSAARADETEDAAVRLVASALLSADDSDDARAADELARAREHLGAQRSSLRGIELDLDRADAEIASGLARLRRIERSARAAHLSDLARSIAGATDALKGARARCSATYETIQIRKARAELAPALDLPSNDGGAE